MQKIRNIAIIAHVDHGKTTIVDKLLIQSGTLNKLIEQNQIMDYNDQERERGITITAKNTAINWHGYRINIVDTPGHADFGGEVERVLSMVDSVLLLVDAADGPMPQTRFVTQKAFARGLNPIVVVNKIDKQGANPHKTIDQVFDLFDSLGASEKQLDFPIIYTNALKGVSGNEIDAMAEDMQPLFEAIIKHVPNPRVNIDAPFQFQVSMLDYSPYVGVIAIGRINKGKIQANDQIAIVTREGAIRKGKILEVLGNLGLERIKLKQGVAGDIVAITGIENVQISDTFCSPDKIEALSSLDIDEPTISMTFQVNDSPFAGRESKFLTSRQIKERLDKELIHNVALRVEQGSDTDKFVVSGRGELHLSVLIETMRREGYELAVSKPEVIVKEIDGKKQEPYEELIVDIKEQHQGAIIEALGIRKANMKNLQHDGQGRIRLEYIVPSRGLIGFRSELLSKTSGSGIMASVFSHYGDFINWDSELRNNGVLISMANGKALAYSLFSLQERGKLFIGHGAEVYQGMVIGIHSRDNDLVVNPTKGKKLDNMRASGSDENLILTPPINMSLEQSLQFIAFDELVEVTPRAIRIRKKLLTEEQRKKNKRNTV